jgi:transcriptional regulator with XRE-family HTH domain
LDDDTSGNGELTDEESTNAVARLGAIVRDYRQRRDMTLAEVADLSLGLLSRLENGIGNPSLSTLTKLADAVGVHVASLFDPPAKTYFAKVTRDERMELLAPAEGRYHHLLQPTLNPRFVVSILKLSASPGNSVPHQHQGTEFISVLSGRVVLTVEEERYVLRDRDSATYDAGRLHSLQPDGDDDASVLYVASPARLP